MTTAPSSPQEPVLPREAYTLLAQANLLRMRGQWDAAVEKCMAALRLAPENASAQSLLGDIYENQGRLDDAIQWYSMALDVNPESPADRLKLGRLLAAKQHVIGAYVHTDETPLPVLVTTPAPPVRSRSVHRTEALLRWGAWLVVILTVLVVVLAGLAMAKGQRRAQPQVQVPAIVIPSQSATEPNEPAQQGPGDPAETSLLQTLQQDAQLQAQDIVPVFVESDPRQNVITLTVLCPPIAAGASAREALLRDSLIAVQAASHAESAHVASWTVRSLLQNSAEDTSSPLALVADTSPTDLATAPSDPSSLPANQLLPIFHNLWWSSSVPQ